MLSWKSGFSLTATILAAKKLISLTFDNVLNGVGKNLELGISNGEFADLIRRALLEFVSQKARSVPGSLRKALL